MGQVLSLLPGILAAEAHDQPLQPLPPAVGSVNVAGGSLNVAGRDIISTQTVIHNHFEPGLCHPDGGPVTLSEALKWLGDTNFRSLLAESLRRRAKGTGSWFLRGGEFKDWFEGKGKVLWAIGMPSAGKTIMASIVTEHIQEVAANSPQGDICICFAYYRYNDKLTVEQILKAMVIQILERHHSLLPLIMSLYTRHTLEKTQPTKEELAGVISRIFKRFRIAYCILDGLDEASEDIQLELLRILSSLEANFLITSRPLKLLESAVPNIEIYELEASEGDIELLVAEKIDGSPRLRKLLESTSLRAEVISTVSKKARGMFLHASLHLDALQLCLNVHEMRKTLLNTPANLEDMYASTMQRILGQPESHTWLAKKALVWVTFAKRPLNVRELREALATSPETHSFDHEQIVAEETVLSVCGGLLRISPSDSISDRPFELQLIHYTAAEFLSRFLLDDFPHPHAYLASVCITFLDSAQYARSPSRWNRKTMGESWNRMTEEHPFLGYAHTRWVTHSQECELDHIAPEAIVQFLLRTTSYPHQESWGSSVDRYNGLHLASRYGLVKCLPQLLAHFDINAPTQPLRTSALILASKYGKEKVVKHLLGVPVLHVNAHDLGGNTALSWAIASKHFTIAAKLLAVPNVNIPPSGLRGTPLFVAAARWGIEELVEILLSSRRIDVNAGDDDKNTALMYAAEGGRLGVVKQLLASEDVDLHLTNKRGETALLCAARSGCLEVVDHLLNLPAMRRLDRGHVGRVLLMSAVERGHDEAVDRAIRFPGLDINGRDETAGSALELAACLGYIAGVAKLLALHDIDTNITDGKGRTPLISASKLGHIRVVELLLSHPQTDVKALDNSGKNALLAASVNGHWHIVRHLLSHTLKMDVNVVDESGRTVLMIAACDGKEEIVEKLLGLPEVEVNNVSICSSPAVQEGSSAQLSDSRPLALNIQSLILISSHAWDHRRAWTALTSARCHKAIFQRILAHPKVNVSLPKGGCTPLIAASQAGYEDLVKLLLNRTENDINAKDERGYTALTMAASRGQEGIVDILMQEDALDINASTVEGRTALIIACRDSGIHSSTALSIVKALLNHPEIDVNAADSDGTTALMEAMSHGWLSTEVIKCLLQHPDIDVKSTSIARPC
ncbi:ankyrin repeat-containing domain protein [Coprinopsis sp. MPI-PUGE-AT-0042]|nr:ankyrin repeat-containing domain protein [Coprinopsis sp. MPI-PUGE-AT-0042]